MKNRKKYLTWTEAMKFIDSCIVEKKIILGVERFESCNNGITPDMEGIADFSDISDACEEDFSVSIRSAKSFLNKFGDDPNELFDIVIA